MILYIFLQIFNLPLFFLLVSSIVPFLFFFIGGFINDKISSNPTKINQSEQMKLSAKYPVLNELNENKRPWATMSEIKNSKSITYIKVFGSKIELRNNEKILIKLIQCKLGERKFLGVFNVARFIVTDQRLIEIPVRIRSCYKSIFYKKQSNFHDRKFTVFSPEVYYYFKNCNLIEGYIHLVFGDDSSDYNTKFTAFNQKDTKFIFNLLNSKKEF
jgi:hypothetical protein